MIILDNFTLARLDDKSQTVSRRLLPRDCTEKGTRLRLYTVCGGHSPSGLSTTRTPVTAVQSGPSPARRLTGFLSWCYRVLSDGNCLQIISMPRKSVTSTSHLSKPSSDGESFYCLTYLLITRDLITLATFRFP